MAVGRAALAGQVVLLELRPAGGSGLEEMFLQLTADDAARRRCPLSETTHEEVPA